MPPDAGVPAVGTTSDAFARVAPPIRALSIGPLEPIPAFPAPPARPPILVRPWQSVDVELPSACVDRPLDACREGRATLDTAPLLWADVLVLRNWYATVPACLGCDVASADEADLVAHAAASGHEWRRAHEGLVRALLETLGRQPAALRGRGLVYELDADPWANVGMDGGRPAPALELELDLVRFLLSTADAVVATTPVAAAAVRREGNEATLFEVSGPADPARAAAWEHGASHAGTGRLIASGAADGAVAAQAGESARRLAIRRNLRALDEELAASMRERTGGGVSPCWSESDAIDPLVSVVIPAIDEPGSLIARAIRSALETGGVRIEVIVAGPPGGGASAAVLDCGDPRVRQVEVPGIDILGDGTGRLGDGDGPSLDGGEAFPGAGGESRRDRAWAMAVHAAQEAARGTWIAPLEPCSVFTPGHVALLLATAIEHGLDVVYGRTLLIRSGEVVGQAGSWPPSETAIAHDAALITSRLNAVWPNPGAWLDGERAVWNLWRRYVELGVRIGSIDEPLTLREVSESTAKPPHPLDRAA